MKKEIKHVLPALEFICQLNDKEQSLRIKKLDIKAVKTLLDILLNVYLGVLPVDTETIKSLKLEKKNISELVKKGKSLKGKIKILSKKGVFKKIFSPILPALRGL